MSCNYCKGSSKILQKVDNLTVDQIWKTIRVMNYPDKGEPTCCYIKINYCPMCGKKLGEI